VELTPQLLQVATQRLLICIRRLHPEKISVADSRFIYFNPDQRINPNENRK
jgi:hypothetical protein